MALSGSCIPRLGWGFCGSAAAVNESASARTAPRLADSFLQMRGVEARLPSLPPLEAKSALVRKLGASYLARHRASRGRHERRRSRTTTWHMWRAQHVGCVAHLCRLHIDSASRERQPMLATLFRHGRAIRRLDSLNSSPSAVLNNIKLSRSCAGAEPALAAKGSQRQPKAAKSSQKQSKAKACMRIRFQCVTLAMNEFALSTVTSAKSLQRGTIRPSPRDERVTKAGAAPTTPPCCRSPLCTEFFHCEPATLRNALVQTTKPFSSVASRCANPRLPLARLTRRGKTAGSSVTQSSHFHRPTVHFAPLSRSLSLSPALGVEAIFPRASQPASSLSAWNIVSHPARAHL
ncbi:hypothetical protein L1887_51199 [Cichorium endivia]|nr:hypothetical protein L1887_51199 [Cichorium endivia]